MTDTAKEGGQKILIPVSFGELIDKITILRIKHRLIEDGEKLAAVARELHLLQSALEGLDVAGNAPILAMTTALAEVNERLWRIEDEIRDCEGRGDFGPAFIGLARSVYIENDRRARIKSELNAAFGSEIVEIKSYRDYRK